MGKFLQHRRRVSLIACIAMLLNLLVPTLSQAIVTLNRDPLVLDICSATRAEPAKPDPTEHSSHALKHCLACAIHADLWAPPPAGNAVFTVNFNAPAGPVRQVAPALPRSRWSSAQPRAPPAQS